MMICFHQQILEIQVSTLKSLGFYFNVINIVLGIFYKMTLLKFGLFTFKIKYIPKWNYFTENVLPSLNVASPQ